MSNHCDSKTDGEMDGENQTAALSVAIRSWIIESVDDV
jgi:hypothetical protein